MSVICEALGDRYESGVRANYGLTPAELSTLVAIATFVRVVGAPMPRWELERAAGKPDMNDRHRLDLTTPGRLHRLGLLVLHGYREQRSYSLTPAGLERIAR